MPELIAFRALQGLGAGGLLTTTIAVVGDIIPPRDRGKYQGLFGAVFGVSTIIGPLLGGFFVDNLSWRWIFYVNLPIGAVALFVIGAVFHTRTERVEHAVDYLGAALLAGGAHVHRPLHEPRRHDVRVGLAGERRADRARRRAARRRSSSPSSARRSRSCRSSSSATGSSRVCAAIGFIIGLALFGSVTYLPLFLQIVKGRSPTSSGLQLTPMMAGLLVTSIVSGRLISRFGRYKPFPVVGTAVMTVGMVLLSRLDLHSTTAYTSLVDARARARPRRWSCRCSCSRCRTPSTTATWASRPRARSSSARSAARSASRSSARSSRTACAASSRRSCRRTCIRRRTSALRPSCKLLPPAVHNAYMHAVAAALHPVFVAASLIAAFSFLLTWLLREVPLRSSTRPLSGDDPAGLAVAEPLSRHEPSARGPRRWRAGSSATTVVGVWLVTSKTASDRVDYDAASRRPSARLGRQSSRRASFPRCCGAGRCESHLVYALVAARPGTMQKARVSSAGTDWYAERLESLLP